MSEDAILIAGTLVEQQKPDGSWVRVPNVQSTGATGQTSEPKEKTTVGDTIKKFGKGLREAPDKSFKLQIIKPQPVGSKFEDDYTLQQDFITRAENEEAFQMRITWPDFDRRTFAVQMLGYEVDDGTAEDWKMGTANGKQNSVVQKSIAPELTGINVSGDSSGNIAVAATEKLTVGLTPLDAFYLADSVTFGTSDSGVATVSEGGVITGVAAGTADITVTMSGGKDKDEQPILITETYSVTVA